MLEGGREWPVKWDIFSGRKKDEKRSILDRMNGQIKGIEKHMDEADRVPLEGKQGHLFHSSSFLRSSGWLL